MSNKAINWVKKIPLSMGETTLLVLLANSFNDKKGCCYPTNKTLAKWCSCSERTIKRYIKSLISKNIIQKEDVRNQLGHRVTSKYTFNFDLNLDSLGDNLSCGQVQSLGDNLSSLGDNLSMPKCHVVTKDYIINKSINKKKTKDFSHVDKNEQEKLEIIIGLKFEDLRKIYDDGYDIESARKLHKQLCLESKRSLQFTDNLIIIRRQQKNDYNEFRKRGKFVAAPCSLKNWLKDKRWLDKIKPLGDKKKVSSCVKCCQCGEEYLKGSYCKVCAERNKPRMGAVVHA